MKTRILLASDVHWCHQEWYGMSNRDRLDKFAADIEAEAAKSPVDAPLLLGDYSLDHWQWGIKGCYINEGISHAKDFADAYLARLGACIPEIRMIAGNHEQYGEAKWREITGHKRQDFAIVGELLCILLDTFAGELDPDYHHDGVYTQADVPFIRACMDAHPDKKVILCAHHFAPEAESEALRTLVREDARILALFGGHVHLSRVVPLGEAWGGKVLAYTGNYSYSGEKPDPLACPWGFREVEFDGSVLTSRYLVPANRYVIGEVRETMETAIDAFAAE